MRKVIPLCLLLGACGTTVSTKLVTRTPADNLMVPCETPPIPPAAPTNQDAAKGWVQAVRIALDCKAKDDGLIDFEKAAPKS